MATVQTMVPMLIVRPIVCRLLCDESGGMIPPQSAKEHEPKRAGKKERQTGINNNRPEDLFVESKTDKHTVRNSRKHDACEQAHQPRRKERPEDVERGRTPAARERTHKQCCWKNQRSLRAAQGFFSLPSREFLSYGPGLQ